MLHTMETGCGFDAYDWKRSECDPDLQRQARTPANPARDSATSEEVERESTAPGAPSPLPCLRRLPRSAHVSSAGAKFPSETSQVERAADSQRLSRHARGRRHECAGEAAGAARRGSQAQGFRGGAPNHTCDAFREEKGRRTRLRIAAENSELREKGNSKTEETLG